MPTRRTLLSLAAGTAALFAGCGGVDEPADGSLSVTASDAAGAPGEDVVVDVTAEHVAVLTFRIGDIPENWPVTYADFDPAPSVVRETYPEELVWDPAVDSTSGTLSVAVANDAGPGTYELPVEVRTANGEESAVSTATITVEG